MCFGTESPPLPYAPSLTQESYRPRVSDRTMVGTSATRLAYEFQRTEWRRHERTCNHREEEASGPRRSPAYRAAPRQAKTVKQLKRKCRGGLDVTKIPLASGSGRSVFRLTSPLIGLPDRDNSGRLGGANGNAYNHAMDAHRNPILRVGSDDAPPVPMQIGTPESGDFHGYEVDLLQKLAERLDFTIQYRRAL